ncbi:LysR substrate-binding domain-containing protein [uncultured Sphingomonas sp.]|uniref:LysR substrate-binding domain-containing protein n=1 Tax=uncultured Sphingomonas sp. TaxID=158754 RepID=UPI0035CAB119
MKLSHLRDTLAVAELGSLRAAGRQLGVAQPAISRSIRELEHELGVALFERHAKGVRLTDMGRAFVGRAESVQSELRRAVEEIEQLKGRATGEVSVAMSTAASMTLMPKSVTEFRKRYPDALLKIHESFFAPIERELLSGHIDFYVGPFESGHSRRFVVEKLYETRRMVVARRGHRLADARTLADVGDAHWIRPALSGRTTEGDFDRMFVMAGLPPPRIVVHARSALITMLTVVNSDLLTVLPKQWIDFPLAAALVAPLKIEPVGAAPMCLVRRPDMPLTPMAEHLCDQVRRTATQHAQALSMSDADHAA